MASLGSSVRIRAMSARDIRRVMEIGASLPFAPQWPVASYVTAIRQEGLPHRIALTAVEPDSDEPVGFVIASVVQPEAELETIAVDGTAQRQHVGLMLLQALVEELRKQEVGELVLEVRASNSGALGFYWRQGFEETGRRVRYYAHPEEDAVLMRLRVS
jgi:[ribosomal protein S18]-alanine N-acetyltransferase